MKRNYVMPLVVLTVICLVASAALALMETATRPIISATTLERENIAMSEIIPDAEGFELIEFDDSMVIPGEIRQAFRTTNNVGYIFIAEINGFSGIITVICGIDGNGEIIAAKTLSHTETQGIGTIIETTEWLAPFKGSTRTLDGVDTVTGATISTRAFINAIDAVFEAFNEIRR